VKKSDFFWLIQVPTYHGASRFDVMLYFNLSNENSDAHPGRIECWCGPQVPHPWLRLSLPYIQNTLAIWWQYVPVGHIVYLQQWYSIINGPWVILLHLQDVSLNIVLCPCYSMQYMLLLQNVMFIALLSAS